MRDVGRERVAAEAAIARAVRERDAPACKVALRAGGYLPDGRAEAVDDEFALRLMRMGTKWYALPGERRFSPERSRRNRERRREGEQDVAPGEERAAVTGEERAAARSQVSQFTLPPETILIRRMHGVVAAVLEQLRAGADWGAIAAEYLHGEPPASPLGQQEAEFLARRRPATRRENVN